MLQGPPDADADELLELLVEEMVEEEELEAGRVQGPMEKTTRVLSTLSQVSCALTIETP
jgi:hypothetical protein